MQEAENLLQKKTRKRQKTNPNPPPSEDLIKKQIRQWTSDCHRKLPQSKELKCAVVNRVVGKMLNSPSTSSTLCQIIQQYNKPLLKNCDRNYSSLVSDVVKLQNHRCRKNMTKFMECVNHVREKYSIWAAVKQLKIKCITINSIDCCHIEENHMAGPCLSLQRKMLFNATQAIRSRCNFHSEDMLDFIS